MWTSKIKKGRYPIIKDTEEIYRKLFQSLEEGKKKEERTLLQYLREKYNIPRFTKVSQFLVKHVPAEEIFTEIVNYLAPFGKILAEIYNFLNQHRTTVIGRADQFAFRFGEMKGRVPFGLDSFPKTLVDVLQTGTVELLSFNPEATGRLLIDTPDCWGDTGALQNIGHHALVYLLDSLIRNAPGHLKSEEFISQNNDIIELVVSKVRQVIRACQQSLIYHRESNDALDCIGYGSDELHFYYRTSEDCDFWTQTVTAYNSEKIDSFAVFERDRDMQESFRRFNLTMLHELDAAWEQYQSHLQKGVKGEHDPHQPQRVDFERYLDAFEAAFRLLFPKQIHPIQVLNQIIDSVIMPYWKHRWRLYEIWALVFTMKQSPNMTKAVPLLVPRLGESGAYDWLIPHGDAKHPVGEILGPRSKLEVWFQRKTPHLAGKGHIEPDIRLMKPSPSDEDVFILELKDRHNGPISHVREVAQKYSSGSSAKWICIANYSSFRSNDIRGKLTTWEFGNKTVFLADQFKPDNVYFEVIQALQQSIRDALSYQSRYDLIADVSGSVGGFDVRAQLLNLVSEKGKPHHFYSFSDRLAPVDGTVMDFNISIGGGTDLRSALSEYLSHEFDNQVTDVVIVTDQDGIEQFRSANLPESGEPKIILMVYGNKGVLENA